MKLLRKAWLVSALWCQAAGCEDASAGATAEHVAADGGQRDGAASSARNADAAAEAHGGDAGSRAAMPSSPSAPASAGITPIRSEPDDDAGVALPAPDDAEQVTLEDLGKRLFEDRSLSLNGTQSCSSCHAAAQAFTGSADHDDPWLPVSRGSPDHTFGTRNTPTAMYTEFTPAFAFVEKADEPGRYVPMGGLFWDGRADSLAAQAAAPFVNPREMALPSEQAVIERVRLAKYADMFQPLFGLDPLAQVESAYRYVTDAIAAFERTPTFRPFSSKFDAFLRGQAQLTTQEQQGFELFKDPEKGNCIACHAGRADSREPQDWLFTDFSYDNLGVPRNAKILDNADPSYFDLGLCQSAVVMGKAPAAIVDKVAFLNSLCGAFKVPTLRNVAKTAPYMHNGYFRELRDAVEFLVTRDTNSARWYSTLQTFDDLPEQHRPNVDTRNVPFDRSSGDEPRLSSEEIDAVVAFLSTLSDAP